MQKEAVRYTEKSPLIKRFLVEGLFGYKNIELGSSSPVSILIAQNGSGKTTLLNLISAFLNCNFGSLMAIDFERIECQFVGEDQCVTVEKKQIQSAMQLSESDNISNVAKWIEVERDSFLNFLLWDYVGDSKDDEVRYRDNYYIRKLFSKTQFSSYKDVYVYLDQIKNSVSNRDKSLDDVISKIRKALNGREVIYLPTYRRIELSLPQGDDSKYRKSTSYAEKLGLNPNSTYFGDIQFGLSDIKERLRQIIQSVLISSNQGYREVSANIVHDLANGDYERYLSDKKNDLPNTELLDVFFKRLQESDRYLDGFARYGRIGGHSKSAAIPNLKNVLEGDSIDSTTKTFLNYFLLKLKEVMSKTQESERLVEDFVDNCNRYLSSNDDIYLGRSKRRKKSSFMDGKTLVLDKLTLEVDVKSEATNNSIPFEALSSGEKQMISLFAKLYLYPKNKILLIDEPELSLSMEWQRKILPDLINAPSCDQLIAITHSPFVFDNDLDKFASPLKMTFSPNKDFKIFGDS